MVHPAFRRMGIAKRLLDGSLKTVETPLIYATIRDTNTASLSLFMAAGFEAAHEADMGDHKIIMLTKKNELYRPPKTESKNTAWGGYHATSAPLSAAFKLGV